MIGSRALIGILVALWCAPVASSERFRPVEIFDGALREVWPAGASPSGSGFPVAPDLAVTAAHVVAGCRVMWVRSSTSGQTAAKILGLDTRIDVALLWVPGLRGVAGLVPAAARRGEPLVLRGFPRRRGRVVEVSFDIDAIGLGEVEEEAGRILEVAGRGPEGLSGGPVLDRAGRVVGMVVARREGAEEHVLAIPSDRLRRFLAYMETEWGGDGDLGPGQGAAGTLLDGVWPMPRPRPAVSSATVLQVGCSR